MWDVGAVRARCFSIAPFGQRSENRREPRQRWIFRGLTNDWMRARSAALMHNIAGARWRLRGRGSPRVAVQCIEYNIFFAHRAGANTSACGAEPGVSNPCKVTHRIVHMLGRSRVNIEKIMTWRAFLQALLMIQKPTTCDGARDRARRRNGRGVSPGHCSRGAAGRSASLVRLLASRRDLPWVAAVFWWSSSARARCLASRSSSPTRARSLPTDCFRSIRSSPIFRRYPTT